MTMSLTKSWMKTLAVLEDIYHAQFAQYNLIPHVPLNKQMQNYISRISWNKHEDQAIKTNNK